ncbi:hypothetical protein [Legionella antarctica]|uniref:hypothetical protein n=1 Tax=Legionella antarctica TaxID=2708020 RepID=UPI0015653ED1|nr:hypothetical protein [Legionella antarctica]
MERFTARLWQSVYGRYNQWVKKGNSNGILEILKKRWRSRMAYDGWWYRSSTSAGAIGGQKYQALGRCRGGFSSKIHAK